MQIVAFANQKGGVGKTSTVVGIAGALDRLDQRVLCVDMDPQADLSIWLGIDIDDDELRTVNDAIFANTPGAAAEAVYKAAWGEHLYCVPSVLDLADRENDGVIAGAFRLATVLQGLQDSFDVVLIDCPPSVGRLVELALVAATHLVVVTEPAAASLRGVARVLDTMEIVQRHYNHGLQLAGIVINAEKRTSEAALRIREVRDTYADAVWSPVVPSRAVVAAAAGSLAPVSAYGSDGRDVTAVHDAFARKVVDLAVMA